VTRSELSDELAMLLGGRTAEELVFADPTTGAQNDIERATAVARQMVTEWGMSEVLGPMRFGQSRGEVFLGRDLGSTPDYSDDVASRIDSEVRHLIDGAHVVARSIIEENRDVLDRLAVALVEHETLEAAQVQQLLGDTRPYERAPAGDLGAGRPAAVAASDATKPRQPPRTTS
jgi:cell division protease FtsH